MNNTEQVELQRERGITGLTQAELGRLVGVSQATISLWENGKARPDEVQADALRTLFQRGASSGPTELKPEPEGIDVPFTRGWGEYPLDSVFVRSDQRTVGEIVKRIRSDRYDLNPEFQRDFVWPDDKQSRLIESCLMRIPLPVLYVAEATDGRIIVVDGLQRLSTFQRFLDNKLKLTFAKSDDVPPHPLEGKRFVDLDLKLQERVEDTQLTLYILDSKAPERAKLDIFERVNSGEPLSRQQMRNCLYSGKATRWLKEAAHSQPFLNATGTSLDQKKMRDREAINRFCAFRLLGWKQYRSGEMDDFLAEALSTMNATPDVQLKALEREFFASMNLNSALFGVHAFRKSALGTSDGNRSVLNIAFFDVCSVGLSGFDKVPMTEQRKTQIKTAIRDLLQSSDFVHAITYSTNSKKQVARRFELMDSKLESIQP